MGRRYVRDKAGRFASKGAGGKSKGGKMGKSAKNVKARAAYKNQAGKLREAKKMAKLRPAGEDTPTRQQKFWNRQLGGAKSGMTRVTNRLTNKRAAATPTKKAAPKRRGTPKQAVVSKRLKQGRLTTPKGKMSKAKPSAAKKAYKKASSVDRGAGYGITSARKKVIKKQTGKTAYQRTTDGQTTLARTKAPRAGYKTKSQKLRAKIDSKKVANESLRGNKFKGAKKRPAYKKPKAGETAKQYKARLKRSGTISTQRALSGQFGTRSEYYSVPGSKSGGKKTRKSINRAKNRDFFSEGSNKRSKAITKSKQRQREKLKKQKAWEKKNKTKAQYKKDAREVRMLRKATTASNIPKGAKKNYLKRANEIEGKYNKKRR